MVRTNSAFFVEIAKNLSFLFADNIRSFIFGMIESMPRSRPVIIAAYRMPERYTSLFGRILGAILRRMECEKVIIKETKKLRI